MSIEVWLSATDISTIPFNRWDCVRAFREPDINPDGQSDSESLVEAYSSPIGS